MLGTIINPALAIVTGSFGSMRSKMTKQERRLSGLYHVLRGVYMLLEGIENDSSNRLRTAINDWITENA